LSNLLFFTLFQRKIIPINYPPYPKNLSLGQ